MSSEFIAALRALQRKRIALNDLRACWLSAHPEQLQHPERDALLLKALEQQALSGELTLPATASYELRGNPRMPKFVTLRGSPPRPPSEDWANVPWLPELGFWTTLTVSELQTAKAINAWLLTRRGRFLRVPLRERSLEIFGDEKYLDTRVRGNALFSGRLLLEAIGAFMVPHPLPYRAADARGYPILVVENHHTYWSLAQWNLEAKRYAAVVWSSGHALGSSSAALEEVVRECSASGVRYFGDLDPRGILIPARFSVESGLPLEPALDLYRMSLEIGTRRHNVARVMGDEAAAFGWLTEYATDIVNLWNSGCWIPQESIGTEQLFRERWAGGTFLEGRICD